VIVNGHTGGRFLDAPEFDDLLGTVEQLGVPLYLTPPTRRRRSPSPSFPDSSILRS
jgi:hypothetical protein